MTTGQTIGLYRTYYASVPRCGWPADFCLAYSSMGAYRRGRRYYIETRDARRSIDSHLSQALNDGNRGYQTKREAENAIVAWMRLDPMSMGRRDLKVIAAVACPRCGAAAGQPCRNPIAHDARRGLADHRAQPIRAHSERRVMWSERKRGV